jgi:hypothetical protein
MEGKFGSVMVALQIYSQFLQKQRYVGLMKLFLSTNRKNYAYFNTVTLGIVEPYLPVNSKD